MKKILGTGGLRAAGILLAALWAPSAWAQVTDVSPVPMGVGITARPNLMFILDASGSMEQDFTPDHVGATSFESPPLCRGYRTRFRRLVNQPCRASADVAGLPPWASKEFNFQYYNPAVTYPTGVLDDGTELPEQNSANTVGWTQVLRDPYLLPTATANILTQYGDFAWCNTSPSTSADLNDPSKCRRNIASHLALSGLPAAIRNLIGDYAYPNSSYFGSVGQLNTNIRVNYAGAPYYYRVRPFVDTNPGTPQIEVDSTLTLPASFAGASVAYCSASVSGGTLLEDVLFGMGTTVGGTCSLARDPVSFPFARFGPMERVDITPAVGRYNVGTSFERTYAAEMTNFANWYAYHRTRILTMKTTTGRVFANVGPEFRVGFVTICPYTTTNCSAPVTDGRAVSTGKFLGVKDFDAVQKADWFAKLYSTDPTGFTPLSEALSRVGRYFAGVSTGLSSGMIPARENDPVQFSCQQNFALLTTDGFSTHFSTQKESSGPVGDQDSSKPRPYFDAGAAADTIADVSMYYYETDLRPSGAIGALGTDVSRDNVRTTDEDPNNQQHMVTFTLGLGVSGQLQYRDDYVEAVDQNDGLTPPTYTTDFGKIAHGQRNWPVPVINQLTAVDDLWHAAVNGRGRYFSAQDPDSLATSMATAISSIVAQTGAAAAAATSNLEPVQGDNFAYTATFRTREWDGDLKASEIVLTGPDAGSLVEPPVWSAMDQLDRRDPARRRIFTFNPSDPTSQIKEFIWTDRGGGALTAAEKALFTLNPLGPPSISQILEWVPTGRSPDPARLANATNGENLVNYLRGSREFEESTTNPVRSKRVFRGRQHVLGDIASSQPQFVREPPFDYEDGGYGRESPGGASFRSIQANRRGIVLVGGNDGMLHAFDGGTKPVGNTLDPGTGDEVWAYVPKLVMADMYHLADRGYDDAHRFYVDGTAAAGDVCSQISCTAGSQWRTIVVSGLNAGGRGYFALDITDTQNPRVLWEFGATDVMGKGDEYFDPDIGLSFGNPLITQIKDPEGSGADRWVVMFTSGINNVVHTDPITGITSGSGDGQGYLFVVDPLTGRKLLKIGTGAGTVANPSGLTRIAGFVCKEDLTDPSARTCEGGDTRTKNFSDRVYGVDLLGNIWRFDVNDFYAESNPFSANIPPSLVTTRAAHLLAVARDAAGNRQPITAKPELGEVFARTGTKAMIYVGTGRFIGETDRGDTRQNTIYGISDELNATVLDPVRSSLQQQEMSLLSADTRTVTDNNVDFSTKRGWFIDFPRVAGASTGERVNINMTLQLGTLVVTSNIPSDDACVVGGESWVNFVDFRTGGPISLAASGIAGRRIADALTVGLNVVRLPDGTIPGLATTSAGEHLKAELAFGAAPPQGRRVSWREIIE